MLVGSSFVSLVRSSFVSLFGIFDVMARTIKQMLRHVAGKHPAFYGATRLRNMEKKKTKVPIAMCFVFIYKSNVKTIRGARTARMPGSEQWLSQATSRRWASTSVGEVKFCEGLCFEWTCVLSVFELMCFEWTCV